MWVIVAFVVGVVFFCVVPLGASTVLAITGLLPVDTEALVARYPAIEDRSGRVVRAEGCGLNERRAGSGCEPVRGAEIAEEEVDFASSHPERGIARLRGTLSIPRGLDGPRPAVVLVHGSGPTCRDQEVPGDLLTRFSPPFPMFRALAGALAEQGLVVLRYDKRHCHAYRADGFVHDPATFEWSHYTDDARDALAFLASRPEVDAERLVVIGHSEGAQLAPFVAEGDPRVAAVVMLAGSTGRFANGMVEQLERFAALRRERHDWFAVLAVEQQASSIRECIARMEAPGFDPEDPCFGNGVTLRAMASFHAYEDRTPEVLRSLHCPLMALQGNADINIDPEEIPRIREIVRGRDAEVHRVHGVSHVLTSVLAPPDPPAVDAAVLELLRAFLASVRH